MVFLFVFYFLDLDFEFHFQLLSKYPIEESLIFFTKPLNDNRTFPCGELDQYLQEKVQDFLTEPQVYTLITFAQDWLVEWSKIEHERAKIQDKLRIQQEIHEMEEKFKKGTPVTKETFTEWNSKFMQEQQLRITQNQLLSMSKLKTGRELFEADKSLVASDLQTGGDDDDKEAVFEFDPSLYEDYSDSESSSSDHETAS